MDYVRYSSLLALGLLLGMLALLELGRRIGTRRLAQDAEGARAGIGAVEGAIFGLLGLLIAFTFSGAASRFDSRRQLVVEETNARPKVSTAMKGRKCRSTASTMGTRSSCRCWLTPQRTRNRG
jgi:hypothetical protein